MLLIFRMGRPDVLPVSDYGIRKGFALTFLRLPKDAGHLRRRPAHARSDAAPRKTLGSIPLRRKLVHVARLQSGEKYAACYFSVTQQ